MVKDEILFDLYCSLIYVCARLHTNRRATTTTELATSADLCSFTQLRGSTLSLTLLPVPPGFDLNWHWLNAQATIIRVSIAELPDWQQNIQCGQ